MWNEKELKPKYDSAKSFYKKAIVLEWERIDCKQLQSYSTIVAEIKNGMAIVYGAYSRTTMRHIRDFLYQNGFKCNMSQKELLKEYNPIKYTILAADE